MTVEHISEFESIDGQLGSFHQELTTLVKKSPNDPLNKFKLELINVILEKANSLLGVKLKPFQNFDQFDADSVPSNSDVLIVIGQYQSSLEKLRADNIAQYSGFWYWYITDARGRNGERSTYRTAPPKKISGK